MALMVYMVTNELAESIFTKIINGVVPCHKIYEDDKVFAFLDIHPISPGHVLVVAKNQVDHLDDLSADDYSAVFEAVKIISKRVKRVLGVKRACLRVEGFDVSHAHVHVIPCNKPSDYYNDSRMNIEPNHDERAELAKNLEINNKGG